MNQKFVELKTWILARKIPNVTVEDTGETILFRAKNAVGRVNFYELDALIVEMAVDEKTGASDDDSFYLHFEPVDMDAAKENFNAMIQRLTAKKPDESLKILFSCTGGLTTGYFASKLNEASKILSRKYEFVAVPFAKVEEVAADFDIIMIAPQVGYKLQELSNKFPDSLVMKIPPKVFAAYDANELVKFFNWYAKYGAGI